MNGQPASALLEQLFSETLQHSVSVSAPLCIAFSGGLDSTVLLHLASRLAARPLRAIHVDHNLHAESAAWAQHCVHAAAQLGIECEVAEVSVTREDGGIEAAARAARYQVFADSLQPEEVLLTAHHARDQLETFLLQALRGAGPRGLAAMPVCSARRGYSHVRPLLTAGIDMLRGYAEAHGLDWLDDPSNAQLDFDRNYLRHEVLPRIEQRWPGAAAAIGRSARLSADAARLLDEMASEDAGCAGAKLSVERLRKLPPARQANVMRFCLRAANLPVPSEVQLGEALQALLSERRDAQPVAAWPGATVRRFRDSLWFFGAEEDPGNPRFAEPVQYAWDPAAPLRMNYPRGSIAVRPANDGGLARHWLDEPLEVRFRAGGERLRPGPAAATRDLKKLLQESDIVPWMRSHIPLLYAQGRLLAAGDLWIDADAASPPGEPGFSLLWTEHGALS